jgi:hypothetical protein
MICRVPHPLVLWVRVLNFDSIDVDHLPRGKLWMKVARVIQTSRTAPTKPVGAAPGTLQLNDPEKQKGRELRALF